MRDGVRNDLTNSSADNSKVRYSDVGRGVQCRQDDADTSIMILPGSQVAMTCGWYSRQLSVTIQQDSISYNGCADNGDATTCRQV